MAEATVAAGYARALVDLAVRKGADRQELLERSGIDPATLEDQDNRIPLAQYTALMRSGQDLSGDPALALHFGEAYGTDELSIVGLIGQASETMADAFAQLDRYSRLIADVDLDAEAGGRRLVLSRSGGTVWLIDTRKDPNHFPELTESTFARMLCSARRFGGAGLVKAVHVTHKAPAWRAEYDRILQVPVTFESRRNALQMSGDSWLALRGALPSRYVFGILNKRAEALLDALESAKTMRGRVENLLRPILHTGEASMKTAAARLGFSRPTLYRRLKEEGTSFTQVLDALRRELALGYLEGGKVSVNETAYLVGFSEPAAFSRAFKRWTGTSPRAMRARERGEMRP